MKSQEYAGRPLRNIKLIIEYDGTRYHGWQVQPNAPTIQGVMEGVICRISQFGARLVSAGRTDAGVHALGQVANFLTPSDLSPEVLKRAINALLPRDICVKEVEEVFAEFHARYLAKRKRYRYRILQRKTGSAFYHRYCWILPYELSLEQMKKASRYIIGTHDFSSFQSTGSNPGSPVREIYRLDILEKDEGWIDFVVEANGFLKQMVRNIVGTLAEVGRGKKASEDLVFILDQKDRRLAGATAPPQGLFLEKVFY